MYIYIYIYIYRERERERESEIESQIHLQHHERDLVYCVIITEEYNGMVNNEELIGTTKI